MPGHVKKNLSTIAVLIVSLLLLGCNQEKESHKLRIAVLPILDTLPMYVAEAEGIFDEYGLEVELIPAASAAERDQLLQAGQVDGVITDLVALALYNKEQTEVIAVRYAMVPTEQFAQFRLIATANSGITTPIHLKGATIGISQGTIIEYLTTRLLERETINLDQIEMLPVPKIPDRMALLNAGELDAAMLPEPLASLVIQQGAVVILDDTRHQDLSGSIYAFRKDFIHNNATTVNDFISSISQASVSINNNKDQWEGLLVENKLVPEPLIGHYTLPDYPENAVPTASQFTDVIRWLTKTERLDTVPEYADVIDAIYILE